MRAHDCGFTLIEVLVAMTVLTVGMLGAATLLLDGLQASRIALQHAHAVALTADVADSIRANRGGGPAYALAAGTALASPPWSCTAAGTCTAAQMAAVDLYRWQQLVLQALPGARTAITVTPVGTTSSHAYEISIRWTQSGDSAAAAFMLTVQA
jgi:type IV pilus assembly protein PilV